MSKLFKVLMGCVLTLGIVGCGKQNVSSIPNLRNTELAAKAMERAKSVEADVYAPREYQIAVNLYRRMNRELADKKYQEANETARLVIDAANEAIRVARLVEEIKK